MQEITFTPHVLSAAQSVIAECRKKEKMIVTAESCTGGLVAGALTEIAGASAVLERGFVTYSNEAKSDMIHVPAELIARYGAVSAQVASAMAMGALQNSRAHLSIAITGIAGPDGGSAEKPVGLVHFALSWRSTSSSPIAGTKNAQALFGPLTRSAIRTAALLKALELLSESLKDF